MKESELTKFVPASAEEMEARKWKEIDILIVSGDAYVDHPTFSTAIVARVLLDAGYRVGIVAQPDWKNSESIKIFGRPRLGCAVSAGNMDSMVKIYTAGRRIRKADMYSEDGKTGMCPPHASVVYAQLAKKAFPGLPVILAGVEASLRRVAHYDYWQDKIRPSMLVDSKADLLCYGMGELTMLEIFGRLKEGMDLSGIRGTCRYLGGKESGAFDSEGCVRLPSYEEVLSDKSAIMLQTKLVESEMNPWNGRRLLQSTNGRELLVEPPREPMTSSQFDKFSELPFVGIPHWKYSGKIPAWETVKDSITVVRGCPGGCAFCGLVCHQGRQLVFRSPESVERSARKLASLPSFKGTISDLGGPAGNVYGHYPKNPELCKKCRRVSCLFPSFCKNYNANEKPLMDLLERVSSVPGVKNIFINSGVRLDLALVQPSQTKRIIEKHVSGQISVAPEHLSGRVLKLMRKGKAGEFESFRSIFDSVSNCSGKKQYIIPYFISNFPGSTKEDMKIVDEYFSKSHWNLNQVQDFIPLPMTMGCAMYCSEMSPEGEKIKVNKGLAERREQLEMLKRRRSGKYLPRSEERRQNR